MTDSKCTGSLASLTDGTLSLHSARYTRLRVFLIFLVLFSDARARARAEDTTEELNCADFCRSRASLKGRHLLIWILRRKRCTSTSFHSKEFARASRFYLRTLHLRLSVSLSLSPVQKGGERRDNSIFFRNSNLGNWEKKGGKENRRAKVRNAFFFVCFGWILGRCICVVMC